MFAALWGLVPAIATGDEPRFETTVKPIFDRYCVDCHSGWFPAGGLRLDSREHVLEGGKQGRAVIPGQPDKGWLINYVRSVGGRPPKMPPGQKPLSDEELETIRAWIAAGAR